MWTNGTRELGIEVTPACGGVEVYVAAVLPAPHSLGGWPDSRCAVWTQYPRPDATVGVLTVPLKGSGCSSRCKCTRCNLTNSHPVIVVSRDHYICQRSTTDSSDCISSMKARHKGDRKLQPTNVKTLVNENPGRDEDRKLGQKHI